MGSPLASLDEIAALTRPSAAYKNSARLAVAGLATFVLLYFALAFWFVYTAYRLKFDNAGGGYGEGWDVFIALCALLLGVFMLKAIFSVKNAKPEGLHEITEAEQPGLFQFLYQLADQAGAPRPHRVYLSARVNAAVFYDLSLLNLIFPSKKNLEIGLALVNVLSLGELRAVLAHEFGHFAQRSMAVGRWVYVAQQIAAHLVARRDGIDDLLAGIANIDLRLRVVVAPVQLVLWSIRSLVGQAFSVVVLMQRALSREMEMQADLVAVSLTGSDALVHALHKLQGADDAWSRTQHFVKGEAEGGRAPRDVFAIQSDIIERMGALLGDAAYGRAPPLPSERRGEHRVFQAALAQPPRMWLTHPLNHEREANAKRRYLSAPIDERSAWTLFEQVQPLRERISVAVLDDERAAVADTVAALAALALQFGREYLAPRYRGVYFGRSLTRHVARYDQLRQPDAPSGQAGATVEIPAAMLYPARLKADVELLRTLEAEEAQLSAVGVGALNAAGAVIRVRGADFKKSELPLALARVRQDLDSVNARLRAHDLLCRSRHHVLAARAGDGWPAYLDGLLAVLHYTEHTQANLEDALGLFFNMVQVATATKRRSKANVARVLDAAGKLHAALREVYHEHDQLQLDAALVARLGLSDNWSAMLGKFELDWPHENNINAWFQNVQSWVDHVAGNCGAVRNAALEQLLLCEQQLSDWARSGAPLPPAPAPTSAPASYATFLHGDARARQTRLGWWARFERADGPLPAAARLLAAGAIIAGVLGLGNGKGNADIYIYNGLALPLTVRIDGQEQTLAPFGNAQRPVAAGQRHHIVTHSSDGRLLEQFDVGTERGYTNFVYNIGGAALLVEWSASYGRAAAQPQPPRPLGAPRWQASGADDLFRAPPQQVSSRAAQTHRVLAGMGALSPDQQLAALTDPAERQRVIGAHARWDVTSYPATAEWLALAGEQPQLAAILATRLQAAPDDVVLRRQEQDQASGAQAAAVCIAQQRRAELAPDSADQRYLALRCLPESADRRRQILAAYQRWHDNGWLAYSAAFTTMESTQWADAIPDLERAVRQLPQLPVRARILLARLKRYHGDGAGADALAQQSEALQELLQPEKNNTTRGPDPYGALGRGQLASALLEAPAGAAAARLQRLVAASDGASPGQVAQALALPTQAGLDASTVWLSVALAMRSGRDAQPYLNASAKMYGPLQPKILAFLQAVRQGRSGEMSEALLDGVTPDVRAYAYGAALVLAGREAPERWRRATKTLLFVPERPHFL